VGSRLFSTLGVGFIILTASTSPTRAGPSARPFGEHVQGRALVAPTLLGPQPWVSILCRFSDVTDTPRSPEWFRTQFSDSYPGLDDYWSEVSYGRMSLAGSDVAGWYDLPQPRSFYGFPGDDAQSIDWDRIREHCIAAADADVDFTNFYGINVMLNSPGAANAGGIFPFVLDGRTDTWGYTVMPAPPPTGTPSSGGKGWADLGILIHEMGHGMSFPHSSGSATNDYDSDWDVTSSPFTGCRVVDPEYGCIPGHPLAQNKADVGWIPPANVTVIPLGDSDTLDLQPAEGPLPTAEPLLLVVPDTGSPGSDEGTWYTAEVRRKIGYDTALPGEGVIIHRMHPEFLPGRGPHTGNVQDQDGDGDYNDEGAIWLPGETFSTPGGIEIDVLGTAGDAYQIRASVPLPNDERDDALTIEGARFTIIETTSSATSSANDPAPLCTPETTDRTIWFALPPGSRTFDISIEADFAGVLATFNGSSPVGCEVTDGTGRAELQLQANGFAPQHLMIGSTDGTGGVVSVTVEEAPLEKIRSFEDLRLKGHLKVVGELKVTGAPEQCSNETVTIEKKARTGWKGHGTFSPLDDGTFAYKMRDKPGRYRLQVPETRSGIFLCTSATSKVVKHRHN
jgi:M6 family metalloprotease-like protein